MSTWRLMTTKGQGHSMTFVQGLSDSTFSNFFSSKYSGPFEAKFQMGCWDENLFKCSGSHVQDCFKAIYSKNLQKSSASEPRGRWPWNLVYSIVYTSSTKRITCIKNKTWPPFETGLFFHILWLNSCRLQNKGLNMWWHVTNVFILCFPYEKSTVWSMILYMYVLSFSITTHSKFGNINDCVIDTMSLVKVLFAHVTYKGVTFKFRSLALIDKSGRVSVKVWRRFQ